MQRTIIDLILLSSLVIAGPISNYQRQQEDRRWFAIDPNQPPVISGPVDNAHSHVEDKRWFDLLDPARRAPVAASDDTRSSEDRIWFHLWPQHGKRQASGTALAQPSQVSTTILPLPAQSSTPSQVQSGGGGKTVTINTQTTIGVTTTITIPANGGSVSSATSSSPTSAVATNGALIPSSATGSINGAQTQPQTQARASSSVSIVFVTLSPTFTGPIAGYTTLTGNRNAAGVAASAPTGSSVTVSASSSPDTSAVTSSGVTAQGSIPAVLSSVFASFDASRSTSAVSTNSANATVSLAGSPQSPSAVSPFPPLDTAITSTSVNAPVSTATVTATVTVAPSLNSASGVSNTQSTASSKSSTTQSSSTFANSSSTSTRASTSSAKSPVSSTSSNSSSAPAASTSINQQGLTVIPITTSATTTVTGSALAPRDAVRVRAAEPAPSGNTVQPFTSSGHDSPLSNSVQALARSTVTILETRTITPSTPAQSAAAAQGLAPEIIPTVQTGMSTVTVTATRVVFATPQ